MTENNPAKALSGETPLSPEERAYHDQAVESYAVERYLLKEMTDEEKLRFEQHYFQCTACMKDVESGQTFVKSIGPPSWPYRLRGLFGTWTRWQAAVFYPIIVASLSIVIFQNVFLIPRLKRQSTGVLPTTVVQARQGERGGLDERGEVVNTAYVTVLFDLPALKTFPYYRIDVLDALNTKRFILSQVLRSPATVGSPLAFTVSKNTLGPGRYRSELTGLTSSNSKDGTPLEPNYFDIQ